MDGERRVGWAGKRQNNRGKRNDGRSGGKGKRGKIGGKRGNIVELRGRRKDLGFPRWRGPRGEGATPTFYIYNIFFVT